MGLYDEIRWDAALPIDHPPDDRIFQTKSLDPCLEHFLVSPEGRLLLVGNGWEDDDLEHAQNLQGIDAEFHGDIRILSVKSYREYLARFTHGSWNGSSLCRKAKHTILWHWPGRNSRPSELWWRVRVNRMGRKATSRERRTGSL